MNLSVRETGLTEGLCLGTDPVTHQALAGPGLHVSMVQSVPGAQMVS